MEENLNGFSSLFIYERRKKDMKRYLFRGKTPAGKWVYGSLIAADAYCCILELEENVHPTDYPYLDSELGVIDGHATPVIPNTVGRLIERHSYERCGDAECFEGDIVEVYPRHCDIERSEPTSIGIIVNEHTISSNGMGYVFPQDTCQIKVIGNVHDNPELVGKEYAELYKHYNGFDI